MIPNIKRALEASTEQANTTPDLDMRKKAADLQNYFASGIQRTTTGTSEAVFTTAIGKALDQIQSAQDSISSKGASDFQTGRIEVLTDRVRNLSQNLIKYRERQGATATDDKIKELEARKAQGAFDVAQYYQDQKQYESAKIYFEEVIKNYPDTDFAQQSRKLLSELGPFLKKETLQWGLDLLAL